MLIKMLGFINQLKFDFYSLATSLGAMFSVFIILILMAPFVYPMRENLYLF